MKSTAKTIVLLAASAAAGVAIGMLLAPDKGTETRKKLMKGGRRLAGGIKQKATSPWRMFKRYQKEKEHRADFLANVHSETNPAGMA